MSNKPPKKSDENKRWRKPRRDRGSRISPEYIFDTIHLDDPHRSQFMNA